MRDSRRTSRWCSFDRTPREQLHLQHGFHARGQGELRRLLSRKPRSHSLGFLGGCIWSLALSLNVLAAGVAGPAISYALGQGATLVAAIWGVFIWREFVGAPAGTGKLIALMFIGYVIGLVLIGAASL